MNPTDSVCFVCKFPISAQDRRVEFRDDKGRVTKLMCDLCDVDERLTKHERTGEISTYLMTLAALEHDRPSRLGPRMTERWRKVWSDVEAIEAERKSFSEQAWLPRLFPQVRASKAAGMIATTKDFKFMTYCLCGRVMVTIEDLRGDGKFGGAWVSLLGEYSANSKGVGLGALCATRDEACGLLRAAAEAELALVDDKEVSVI